MSLDPPITLTGELTLDDVRIGWRLAEASIWSRLRRAFLILVTLGCVILLWRIGVTKEDHGPGFSDRMLIVLCVVVPTTIVIWYFWRRNQLQRAWEQKEQIFRRIETTISENGLMMLQAHRRSEIQWPFFNSFRRTENLIILYHSDSWMLFARSRFGSQADWERFVSFVETNFPRRL